MARDIGQCVLLVSPNGNYAEVLNKEGETLTVRMGCGRECETTLAEFEKLGAKPVQATRFSVGDSYTYLSSGPTFQDLDMYAEGKRYEMRRKKR